MLKSYLKEIYEIHSRGDATEESYYRAISELFQKYAESEHKNNTHITTLPKKTEAGNPDFRVWDGSQHIVGYIEAKSPTTEYLDQAETTEQLKRYLKTFPNLILTNFFEFRLYRNGNLIDKVCIGRPFVMRAIKTIPPVENQQDFIKLLEKFFSFSLPKFNTAESLAITLADKTRFLRDEVVVQELKAEGKEKYSITGFFEAFKQYLIHDLSKEDFADLYSQTITYGLFASRVRSKNGFNRKLAYDNIPHTIGILRDMFRFISLEELPKQMEWIVDDISGVLAITDVNNILHQYFHKGKGEDPVIHFYETFLAEYDPKTRERRGVYYTPEPVVSYIVQSVHLILKEYFEKKDGFASKSVTVLDPAAGTLTFLAEASKIALEEFALKYGKGGDNYFIREHILENFFAFELMMAPYAIGHLKMSFLLEELGYTLKDDDRFKLYLTNTLEMEEYHQTRLPGMASLSEESHLAGKVKKEQPILVILGNPPYSVSSVNKSEFIEKEMRFYKEDVRNERNIQPLSDDYIKFIRFAHWKIDRANKGIIGMITNNTYLSGLIHRGMRKKLLESFDEIYILNLHGNSRIGEKCPDGSNDENVFDIQQGVSIALFIKSKSNKGLGKVFYHDIYGQRESKYEYLVKNSIKTTKWKRLKPTEPYYFFVKKDFSQQTNYNAFIGIRDIFNLSSSGVKTHRDHFVVGFTREEIEQRLRMFAGDMSDELVRHGLKLKDTHDFTLKEVRKKIKEIDWNSAIIPYAYRPFDNRFICYRPELIDRDRYDVMQHFFKKNLGLMTSRQVTKEFKHAFVSNNIINYNSIDTAGTFGTGYVFPLFVYPIIGEKNLFKDHKTANAKQPNINGNIFALLKEAFAKKPTPEDIFCYIYAVLYSNIYRTKYAEFLKIDFPRIPFTKDYTLFRKMAECGKRLVDLHLLASPEIDTPAARFQGKGDNRIGKLHYEFPRLFINDSQYFEGMEQDVFEYQIGGYQVCEKWLKDRKGRKLSLNDIKHYCNMATAIKKTIEVQKIIDTIYPEAENKTTG
ncbi:MAG: N-6 DNA methylase [Candidatus Kuenenia sp.]|nr:N-6 DNA methylase [Candidatus Kuenenia hertensis]